MKRQVPKLATDETAEAFLDQDLSDLDFAQFKAGQLEFERKDARLTMRVPQLMLDAVKQRANARGIPTSASSARRSSRLCRRGSRRRGREFRCSFRSLAAVALAEPRWDEVRLDSADRHLRRVFPRSLPWQTSGLPPVREAS